MLAHNICKRQTSRSNRARMMGSAEVSPASAPNWRCKVTLVWVSLMADDHADYFGINTDYTF
jgi:hypothetical protein